MCWSFFIKRNVLSKKNSGYFVRNFRHHTGALLAMITALREYSKISSNFVKRNIEKKYLRGPDWINNILFNSPKPILGKTKIKLAYLFTFLGNCMIFF